MEEINWRRFGVHNGRPVYTVYSADIRHWIDIQPPAQWQHYVYSPLLDYVFTEEFETMFLLRWS